MVAGGSTAHTRTVTSGGDADEAAAAETMRGSRLPIAVL